MPDYQKMYYTLFHATEDAISILETPLGAVEEVVVRMKAIRRLTKAQQKCEDIYVEDED